jgi:hypothetical protein
MAYAEKSTVNIWDELSRRCFGFNRELLKRYAYIAAYSGKNDPWLDHIIKTELEQITHGIR